MEGLIGSLAPDTSGAKTHKWFCSAPQSNGFFTLAKVSGGVTCFFLPRTLPDGSYNRFFVQRLKDKAGNKSNASSDVEYSGTMTVRVGEEGHGLRIAEAVTRAHGDSTSAPYYFCTSQLQRSEDWKLLSRRNSLGGRSDLCARHHPRRPPHGDQECTQGTLDGGRRGRRADIAETRDDPAGGAGAFLNVHDGKHQPSSGRDRAWPCARTRLEDGPHQLQLLAGLHIFLTRTSDTRTALSVAEQGRTIA
jgi:hypothetical protein